jgi:hypothetical protein
VQADGGHCQYRHVSLVLYFGVIVECMRSICLRESDCQTEAINLSEQTPVPPYQMCTANGSGGHVDTESTGCNSDKLGSGQVYLGWTPLDGRRGGFRV